MLLKSPGPSAFGEWALVPWCVGRAGASGVWSCRLVPLAGLVVWPRRCGFCPPGSVSSLFLCCDQPRAGRALCGGRISKEGRRPKDRSLDRYPPFTPGVHTYDILWAWDWVVDLSYCSCQPVSCRFLLRLSSRTLKKMGAAEVSTGRADVFLL